jgi:predicted metalloprotease with PDZ domain
MYDLVYVKGAQVCMLMDRRIREASGGHWTLDVLLGILTKNFKGRAFYRNDFLGLIQSLSGANIDDIFSRYVDTPGLIPDSVLHENWARMKEIGAFDSQATVLSALSN